MELRQIFAKTLSTLMKTNNKICILDADLSKPNGTFPLYQEFPNRCFNVGISEQNMAGMAAGLAAYGFIPIIVTFTPFATRRVCDQVAVSIAYAKQKVIIIGTDPGITAEMNGGTHMSVEDIGVMRSIPSMLILDIVDGLQLSQALPQVIDYPGPVYLRMARKASVEVYPSDYRFELGKADIIKEGTDITIIAGGTMVFESLVAHQLLADDGISAELISVNTIKPLDKETLLKSIKKTNKVVVCENHNLIGGLFSAIAEMVALEYPIKLKGVGIKDIFGQVGKYQELLEAYEMTPKDIVKVVKEYIYEG